MVGKRLPRTRMDVYGRGHYAHIGKATALCGASYIAGFVLAYLTPCTDCQEQYRRITSGLVGDLR